MASEEYHNEGKEELPDLAPFNPTKKKKKKKTTTLEFTDENADPVAEKTENLTVSDGVDASFAGLKKKPVDPKLFNDDDAEAGEDKDVGEDEQGVASEQQSQPPSHPWEQTDLDYIYEELVGRVFSVLREYNPELVGDRRRTVIMPPQVMREGTKKTVFANFAEVCKRMHRQPDHVMFFLLAELGTSGSLDGQQRLVVKGRFTPKNFEGILRRYMNEYVICNGCKGSDTIFVRENRVNFLRCEQCGSGRSVPPINGGYIACIGRRNATA